MSYAAAFEVGFDYLVGAVGTGVQHGYYFVLRLVVVLANQALKALLEILFDIMDGDDYGKKHFTTIKVRINNDILGRNMSQL